MTKTFVAKDFTALLKVKLVQMHHMFVRLTACMYRDDAALRIAVRAKDIIYASSELRLVPITLNMISAQCK